MTLTGRHATTHLHPACLMPLPAPLLDGPASDMLDHLDLLLSTWSDRATRFRALQQRWMTLQDDFMAAATIDYDAAATRMLETNDVDQMMAELAEAGEAGAAQAERLAHDERAIEAESATLEQEMVVLEEGIQGQVAALRSAMACVDIIAHMNAHLVELGVDSVEARELAAILAGEPGAVERQHQQIQAAMQLQSALMDQMHQTQQRVIGNMGDDPVAFDHYDADGRWLGRW